MPVKSISCQMGALTPTGMTAVILSHSSAAATLSINGQNYPIDMTTAFGNDRNADGAGADIAGDTHVCYIGSQIITGLEPLTSYSWTVTQGENSDSGNHRTSTTSKATKIAVALATCFNLTDSVDANGWAFLRQYIDNAENPPLLAVLHVDDICYADGAFSGIQANAFNSQGKEFTDGLIIPGTSMTYTQYDYSLYYAAWFGILDAFYNTSDTEQANPLLTAGLDEDMQYVRSRTAFMPSAGDHEYNNNLGWGVPMNDYPNGYHHTGINDGTGTAVSDGNYDGRGLLTYNAVMQPLSGTSAQNRDTNAKHWYADFGSFRYIAMDGTTNAVQNVTVYGNDQIDDVLDLFDGSVWWTCVGAPAMGCRASGSANAYPSYAAWLQSEYDISYQVKYKNESFVQSEHDRLWRNTGQTPKAILDNSFGNGTMGMAFMARGDWHNSIWARWSEPESAGKAAENIHEIGLQAFGNTAYGGNNLMGGANRDAQLSLDNCELIGALTNLESDGFTTKPNPVTVTIIEINGEKQTPEMRVIQWGLDTSANSGVSEIAHFANQNGRTLTDHKGNIWRVIGERKFIRHLGNDGYLLEESSWYLPKISL